MSDQTAVCARHPEQVATARCGHCETPICRECIKQFGYFCSRECLDAARSQVTDEDREAQRESREKLAMAAKVGRVIVTVMIVGFVLGTAWLAWKLFLDPSGKLSWRWEHEADLYRMRILDADEQGVTVLAGANVFVLDPVEGEVLRSFELKGPAAPAADAKNGDGTALVGLGVGVLGSAADTRLVGDVLVRTGPNGVESWTTAGKCLFRQEYELGAVSDVVVSPDASRVLYVATTQKDMAFARKAKRDLDAVQAELEKVRKVLDYATPEEREKIYKRLQDARERLGRTERWIVCLRAADGASCWRRRLNDGSVFASLAAGETALVGVLGLESDLQATGATICALKPADGKALWQTKLSAPVTWGPRIEQGLVLFRCLNDLHAVTETGEERYSVPLPADGMPNLIVKNGLLVVAQLEQSAAYDLATGDKLWAVPLCFHETRLAVGEKRVLAVCEVEERRAAKDIELPPAYEELGKMKEFSGIVKQATTRTVPILIALDRETGEELWKQGSVYGDLVADDRHVVMVADTAHTSMLNMATGGEGVTLLRQFKPRNGKELYQRQDDIGFRSPVLVGNRLVGLAYKRTRSAGALNPFGGEHSGPTKGLGVAAFRVR